MHERPRDRSLRPLPGDPLPCDLLPDNVALETRSWLYSNRAFAHCRSRRPVAVRIGADSGVYGGTMFDLGPDGEVEIGDFCCLVGAILATNGRIAIGDHSLIAQDVVIADEYAAVPAPCSEHGPPPSIEIGRNAWIGARAVLLPGAHIGADAIVGAGAVVDFEVPPGAVAAGNPARIVRLRG
jgi:acetyltransferase-like isoleucine patch superfamily enzyme